MRISLQRLPCFPAADSIRSVHPWTVCLRPGQVVSLESTTYPGTTDEELRPRVEATGLKAGTPVVGGGGRPGRAPKRTDHRPPPSLSAREVDAIQAVPDTATLMGARDAALLKLLYNTGARVQELADCAVTDLRLDLPLEFLAALPTGMPKGWRGRARGTFADLRLVAGWPVQAQGTLEVDGLVVPRLNQSTIGSFEVRAPDPRAATAGAPAVTARVTDKDALLSVDAVLTLSPGRSFQLEGSVAPRAAAPPDLLQALEFLGPADAGQPPA